MMRDTLRKVHINIKYLSPKAVRVCVHHFCKNSCERSCECACVSACVIACVHMLERMRAYMQAPLLPRAGNYQFNFTNY